MGVSSGPLLFAGTTNPKHRASNDRDIYTKYATIVPLDSKQPLDVGTGVHEAINAMGKAPHILYTDDEGNVNSQVF